MVTLTPALRRKITSDWRAEFGALGTYKPMWLGRLVGPFFQGVCLERNSGNASYLPTSHIHFLGLDWSTVSLTLAQRLRSVRSGTSETISVRFHEAHCAEAAERLKQASLLSLEQPWGLRDLILAVDAFQRLGYVASYSSVAEFECVVLAAAMLGDTEQAQASLAHFEAVASAWPANFLHHRGGVRSWADRLRRLIDKPDSLWDAARRNAEKLKAVGLPRNDLVR